MPPSSTSAPHDLSALIAARGLVVATLKPSGKIEIEGQEFAATTLDGKLLERGSIVQVSSIRNTMLVVSAVETN